MHGETRTTSALSEVTRRARDAVGSNPRGNIRIPPLADQVRDLPPEAGPLRRILESEAVHKAQNEHDKFDDEAVRARTSYDRSVLTIILLVFSAVAFGLAPSITPETLLGTTEAASKWLATAFIYAALIFSLLIARRLDRKKTYEAWNEARGSAEFMRRKIVETVMHANETSRPGELPVWPLKLEYFRRYQLDVQEAYHQVRAAENEGKARRAKLLIVPCLLSVAVWVFALAFEVMAAWGEQGPLPASVPTFAYSVMGLMQKLTMQYTDIKWLWVGLGTACIYGLVFLFTTLNSRLRNAARFRRAAENFAHLRENPENGLDKARAAAAAEPADVAGVLRYVARVHSAMSSELSDWVRLSKLDAGQEMAPSHAAVTPGGTL